MSELSHASVDKNRFVDGGRHISITTVENSAKEYNHGVGTRRACLIGLAVAWILGVTLLVIGACLCANPGSLESFSTLSFPHSTPRYIPDLLPLIFNLVVTLINETLGFTHTTCLRWALQTENRLKFNSNLRLLTSSRTSKPNKWYSNLIFVICLVLSYSTPSQILEYQSDPSSSGSNQSDGPLRVTVNAVAIVTLGIAFLGQAAIATWACSTTAISTWSSSPIDTIKASQQAGGLQHFPGRCMRSVDQQDEPSVPALPRPCQCSAWSAHKEVRWVLLLFCALLPLGAILVGVCYSMFNSPVNQPDTAGSFSNWALLPTDIGHTASGSPFIALDWPARNNLALSAQSLAFVSALQTVITLALHCVELLVNLSRDEAIWRRATSTRGLDVSTYNSVTSALTAWQTVMLFLFKSAIHWLFGLSITVTAAFYYSEILLRPIQMIYLMALVAILAATTIWISTRRPRGPQPAAYGHLQTMANLVDEWAPIMYWGDKSSFEIYHAGTSSMTLPDVDIDRLYS